MAELSQTHRLNPYQYAPRPEGVAGDYDIGSGTLPGLLLGTGFEYAFAPNWSAKLEYNYIGFSTKVISFASTVEDDYRLSVSASKHIVKAGLNYRFGDFGKGPVVTRY